MSFFPIPKSLYSFKQNIQFSVCLIAMLFCFVAGKAENKQTDSLMKVFNSSTQDSVRVNILNQLSKQLLNSDADKSFAYAQQSKDLATKIGYKYGLAYAYKYLGIGYFNRSDYISAIKDYQNASEVFKSINDKQGLANMYSNIGTIYFNKGDDERALDVSVGVGLVALQQLL